MAWLTDMWGTVAANVWLGDVFILFAGFLVHLAFRLLVLRGLEKIAAATDNDLDDRITLIKVQVLNHLAVHCHLFYAYIYALCTHWNRVK